MYRALLWWLASRAVNVNPDNCNWGPGNVDNGRANSNDNDMFNSNGDSNNDNNAVRPVDSINCGYAINNCIRDNIETNNVL